MAQPHILSTNPEKSKRHFVDRSHCALYGFLMDYIKDVFLGQIRTDNSDALNEASLLLDSWKALTDIDVLRDHGYSIPEFLCLCLFTRS